MSALIRADDELDVMSRLKGLAELDQFMELMK